ncbi:hypothetical protein THII_1486 [Thioploca ingrica]|uniref:Bacterial repeat domain-containing protein n=1 Tax=Thioploca ingrica TaxID=40754 RepID=A0A090AD78_9GAMM|nr:hypothetical protein THII_1486 [Thioploca ingrica]
MLAQNRDMGWLSPLFLACPLRQRYFNFPSQWEKECTSIHSFIFKYSPGKRLFAWLDSISAFGRRLLFFTLIGLSSVQAATTCTAVTEIPQAECETLVALYNSTDGPNWLDSSANDWNMTNTPCTWIGISCSGGHIISIYKQDNKLNGIIPDLSVLTSLQGLDLSNKDLESSNDNKLSGTIPDLSALTQLQVFNLNGNQLSGPIPDLSALTQLQELELQSLLLDGNGNGNGNWLTGSIPDLSALTQLRKLDLSYNHLDGPIPDLSALTQLQSLDLSYNQLTGPIPDLSALTQLQHLVLDGNWLTGSIPDLSALTQLRKLDLYLNHLDGPIPDLSALTQLQGLGLGSNQLSGPIPDLSALTQLQGLGLGSNQLSGPIPDLSALTQLQGLGLESNHLSGPIPNLSALTQLQGLVLRDNQLSGPIPDLSALTQLQTLSLGSNQLTGPIPDLSALTQLRWLDLSFNQLTGTIPDLSALTQLGLLYLLDNQLCGEIPSSLVNIVLSLPGALGLENSHLTASDPILIAFLNSENPAWINQTPNQTPCGDSSPPSTPLPSPTPPSLPPLDPLPPTMTLTLHFSGNGHGHVTTEPSGIDCDNNQTNCTHSFETATWINLTATPTDDSQFTGWSGNQTDCDNGELFMSGSRSCTAYFELLRFPLTITTIGQGQINSDPIGIHCGDQCQSHFDIGTNVTLTAIPAKGWQFQEWSGDCDDQGTVVIKANKACQATFTQLPPDFPPVADAILTACANAIPWDGQSHEDAVVKNTDTLNLIGSSTPLQVKALCNYGTIQETAGELLSIQVNPTEGFIYNEGSILGKDGESSTAQSTIPTHLVNTGNTGSGIKLKAGTQLYHQGTIQAGAGGNGYLTAGPGGSVEIYADQIIQAGIIAAGHGGEGNAHQPEWDGVWGSDTIYGNQPVKGGDGGKTVLQAEQSLYASAVATTSSGTGGNAYVWCRNGAHLIDWWFDGRWYAGTCVSDDANIPVAIPTPGTGGDLIQLSPAINDVSKASSGNGLYYEPSTITLGTTTRLQAQQDIVLFGGEDWVLDLRHLSPGAITTPGNITLAVGKNSTIDLRGNTSQVFQAGGQFTVFTDTLLLDPGISLADLVDAKEGIVTHPSKILHQVILTGPSKTTGEPQATLPIELELINGGPEADTYNFTVSDSASWNLTTLPAALSVAGLGHETLPLNITLPAMAGEQDTITVAATSAAEPTVTSTTQIVVKVAGEPTQFATTAAAEVNQPPITTASAAASNSSEVMANSSVELPPVTASDSPTLPAADPFSSLPPETPPCYASSLVDWICNAQGQILTDLTVGPNGMIAYGTLVGTLTNQGRVSNLTLEPHSQLTGGIVTGYLINHGEMADFEFRGAVIVGGVLAGQIINTSQVGGYFRDVQLAAGTHLLGGQLAGEISGDAQASALLEHLEIQAGSYLEYVTIGEGVKLAVEVNLGEGVQFIYPSEDPRLSSK